MANSTAKVSLCDPNLDCRTAPVHKKTPESCVRLSGVILFAAAAVTEDEKPAWLLKEAER
jgi:hypothetical protein